MQEGHPPHVNHPPHDIAAATVVAAATHNAVATPPPPPVTKGVGRVIRVPDPQWRIRVLVKDAFGRIVIIVASFAVFFCLRKPQRQEDNANQKLFPSGYYQGGK